MANSGQPGSTFPVANELKRLRGNPGKHPIPDERAVQPLTSSADINMLEHVPKQLRTAGIALWNYVWGAGACWISPQTDASAVTKLCEVSDYAEMMRAKFYATGEICYSREYLTATDKQIVMFRELGLTPISRSKLGVAEVKTKSRIEQLRLDKEREERLRADKLNGK
jgi:hypothetical protein